MDAHNGFGEEEFREAFALLVQEIQAKLSYGPTGYIRLREKHRPLGAARLINYGPVSDDSLAIAARGRPDLTIETLVCDEKWAALFTQEERDTAASRRQGFDRAAQLPEFCSSEPEAPADISTMKLLTVTIDASSSYEVDDDYEDDIVWGEELLEGIGVCEKTAVGE